MTPETRGAALAGLRFAVKSLKPGQQMPYWKLMDAFDGGDSDLSRELDADLHALERAGVLRLRADDAGGEFLVERVGKVAKKQVKKGVAAKPKPKAKRTKAAPRAKTGRKTKKK